MASMKLLSLVGAATAAVSAAASSSSITAVAASSPLSRRTSTRTLNDADGNTYAYLQSLYGYSLKYSHCVRVKIPQEYDDDAVDGKWRRPAAMRDESVVDGAAVKDRESAARRTMEAAAATIVVFIL